VQAVRQNKATLICLLQGTFVIVRSELLPREPLIWVETEEDRAILVAAGASQGLIYTKEELALLAKHPPSDEELVRVHDAKHMFNGRSGSHDRAS